MKILVCLAALLLAPVFCLIGCGDSNSSSSPEPVFLSGQIIDAVIEGLDYRTASTQDVTDETGTFSYQEGEVVTFSIGDLELGEATGGPILTIIDIVSGARDINHTTVMNIARLLQSIDFDRNPGNGIRITRQIRNEVSGSPLDFSLAHGAFDADSALINLFNRLNAIGAFSDGQEGFLWTEAAAKAHFTQAYKDTWKIERVSIDTDEDGIEDAFVEYFRDAAGNVTRTEDSSYGNQDMTYDENGYMTRRESDYEGDGVIDRIEASVYDSRGNIIERRYDSDGDGVWNNLSVYEYDAGNRITKQSMDDNADGHFDSIWSYVFDPDGNPTRREDDRDADGDPDSIWYYTYSGGNLSREDYDDNGDSIIDRFLTYTYDANGNRLTTVYDDGPSRINDWAQTWTYDADNLRKTVLTTHNSAGSNTTSFSDFDYDSNGNEILSRSDNDYDEITPEWDYITTRVYDDQSRMLEYSNDNGNDGVVDFQWLATRDDKGNVIASSIFNGTKTEYYEFTWTQSITSGWNTWVAPRGSELGG